MLYFCLQIKTVVLVPPLAVFLVKSPLTRHYDLSSIKRFFIGAAPLTKETEQQLFEKFGVHTQQGNIYYIIIPPYANKIDCAIFLVKSKE